MATTSELNGIAIASSAGWRCKRRSLFCLASLFLIGSCIWSIQAVRANDPSSSSTSYVANDFASTEYPWMAAIKIRHHRHRVMSVYCSGVLIASQWVLTLAKCVESKHARDIEILLGVNDLNDTTGERFGIAQVIGHPDFVKDPSTAEIKVALLRLARPTTANALPFVDANWQVSSRTLAQLLGWGDSAPTLDKARFLVDGMMPLLPDRHCDFQPQHYFCGKREPRHRQTPCDRDNGGPVIITDEVTGEPRLAGLMSATCYGSTPVVSKFVRLTTAMDWIDRQTGGSATANETSNLFFDNAVMYDYCWKYTCYFEGSDSHTGGVGIRRFQWRIDGAIASHRSRHKHIFTERGIYSISLKTILNDGRVSTCRRTVRIPVTRLRRRDLDPSLSEHTGTATLRFPGDVTYVSPMGGSSVFLEALPRPRGGYWSKFLSMHPHEPSAYFQFTMQRYSFSRNRWVNEGHGRQNPNGFAGQLVINKPMSQSGLYRFRLKSIRGIGDASTWFEITPNGQPGNLRLQRNPEHCL